MGKRTNKPFGTYLPVGSKAQIIQMGLNPSTVLWRIREKHMTLDEAIKEPVRKYKKESV